eukprot:COSAG06_NODE_38961_length_417_cov_7.943396_1_plen_81_part_10
MLLEVPILPLSLPRDHPSSVRARCSSAAAAAAATVLESPSTDEAEPPSKKVKFAEDLAPVAAMAAGLKQVIDAAEENKATD